MEFDWLSKFYLQEFLKEDIFGMSLFWIQSLHTHRRMDAEYRLDPCYIKNLLKELIQVHPFKCRMTPGFQLLDRDQPFVKGSIIFSHTGEWINWSHSHNVESSTIITTVRNFGNTVDKRYYYNKCIPSRFFFVGFLLSLDDIWWNQVIKLPRNTQMQLIYQSLAVMSANNRRTRGEFGVLQNYNIFSGNW